MSSSIPTRGESVLDLILSREPELVSNIEVKDKLGNGDHNMLTFQVHLDLTARDSTTKHRDYNKGNNEGRRSALKETDWTIYQGPERR